MTAPLGSSRNSTLDRRRFLVAGLAVPFARAGRALAGSEIFIGDMHFHLFFIGPKPASAQPLGRNMRAGGATLVSWSLVGDLPWLRPARGTFRQSGEPKPGEAAKFLREELGRVEEHIAGQNLKIVRDAGDIRRALLGDPHVVLSVEGAGFADDDLAEIERAYEAGIRHIQLVHFVRNPVGDVQTEMPVHHGLTGYGRDVVRECNRLGILVDLSHCTGAVVSEALAVSKAPMVWSHGSVTKAGKPNHLMPAWKARQLPLELASAIAGKGGVIGLWTLRADVGNGTKAYARRLIELAGWIGDDHVAFGTDMNAMSNPIVANYADLRAVVRYLQTRKIADDRIRKLAIENYARVLTAAFAAREA